MTNNELKKVFSETIPGVLNGDYSNNLLLADALKEYTWSYSKLKKIADGNVKFLSSLISSPDSGDALYQGEVIHSLVLGTPIPKKYLFEKIDKRTSLGKVKAEEAKVKGIIYLDPKIKEVAEACKKSIDQNPHCAPLFKGGVSEKWLNGNVGGYKIGGYIDKILDTMAVELKSCNDASQDKFERSAVDNFYPLQVFIYSILTDFKEVKIPIVETIEPYRSRLFSPSKDFINYGKLQLSNCLDAMDDLIYLLENKMYLGFNQATLDIPKWKRYELSVFMESSRL